MRVNFKIIKNKEKESVNGKMVKFLKESGLKTICMGGDRWFGLMEKIIQDNLLNLSLMGMVNLFGLRVFYIKENGEKEILMEKDNFLIKIKMLSRANLLMENLNLI